MKFRAKIINLNPNIATRNIEVKLMLINAVHKTSEIDFLKHTEIDIDIDKHRDKRSLNANAYMWTLLRELANTVKTTEDELYEDYIRKYGVYQFLVVKPSAVETLKKQFKIIDELGEIKINGQTGIQLKAFFTTSTYNSKEMARIIEAIVQDCKAIGIETRSPEEIKSMCEIYNR